MVSKVILLPCPSNLFLQQFSGLACPPSLLVKDSVSGCQLEWLKCRHRSPSALPAAHSTFSLACQAGLGRVLSSSRICQSPWASHSGYLCCCELGCWTLYSCIQKSHFCACEVPLFSWWCHRIILILYLVLAFRALALAFFSGLALKESKQAKAPYRAEKHFTKHILMKSAPWTAATGTAKQPEIQKGECDGRFMLVNLSEDLQDLCLEKISVLSYLWNPHPTLPMLCNHD